MSALLKTILLVFKGFLDLLFPPSEDEKRIAGLTPNQFLQKLSVRTESDTVVLSHFSDPEVRAAIHLVKFHRHPDALSLSAALLGAWLCAHVDTPAIIIPIPLSDQRLRKRGFNQAELIARVASQEVPNVEVRTNILKRTRHTEPQTTLKRRERLRNVTGAFTVSGAVKDMSGQTIIIFDDVMTTGATLKAAKAALLPLSPASITCVTLAH